MRAYVVPLPGLATCVNPGCMPPRYLRYDLVTVQV